MDLANQRNLLRFVERWVHGRVSGQTLPAAPEGGEFDEERGLFVTLRVDGLLRGCIGSIQARGPICEVVVEMAEHSLRDPRFVHERIQPEELDRLDVEITLLDPPRPISDPNEMEVGKHGILIEIGSKTGVYLPQVAIEQGWDVMQTIESCCRHKLGLPGNSWQLPEAKLSVFEGLKISNEELARQGP